MTYVLTVVIAGVLTGCIYGLIALGLSLIFGVMRIINFAHGDFVMVAMFATLVVVDRFGISPYLAALPVGAAFFVVGVGFWLLLRPLAERGTPPIVIALITLGVGVAIDAIVTQLSGAQLHVISAGLTVTGWTVDGVNVSGPRLFAAFAAMLLLGALLLLLKRTTFGLSAVAVAQDRPAAEVAGIDTKRINLLMFGLSTALAGVAGSMLVSYLPASPNLGLNFDLLAFVIVVLGGLGSISGVFVAGVVVGVIENLVSFYIGPGWQDVAYLVLFMAILLLKPEGLFGRKGDVILEVGS